MKTIATILLLAAFAATATQLSEPGKVAFGAMDALEERGGLEDPQGGASDEHR